MSSFSAELHQHRNLDEPLVSVVIPALNEARNLEILLPTVAARRAHQVILVDGGSSDDTVAVARRLLPEVRIVHQVRRGKGNALAAGLAVVTGDIVVVLDADLGSHPAEIPGFVQALVDGADVATGARKVRTTFDSLVDAVFTLLFGTGWADLRYGFHAFWADMIPLLDLPDHRVMTPLAGQMFWGDGFEIEAVLACRLASARAVVAVVPATPSPRIFGSSKLRGRSDGIRLVRTLLVERRRARATRRLERSIARTAPAVRPVPRERAGA